MHEKQKCTKNVPQKGIKVRFFGQPSYQAVEEYDNNGRKVLCTLKFVSNDNIPLHKHLAFVITDASGTSFIIGSRERPYPVVKSSATSGTTPTRQNYFRHLSLKTKKKIKAIGSDENNQSHCASWVARTR